MKRWCLSVPVALVATAATAQKRFADLGATTYPTSQVTLGALSKHLKSEMDKWGALIRKAGTYAD
jgi:hypothetical protein